MAKIELVMPKMGESIMEATILNWVKNVGDEVKEDETILEIATDKVDSEIPSPVDGVLKEILFNVDDTIEVGTVIAIIEKAGGETESAAPQAAKTEIPAATPAPVKEKQSIAASNGNGTVAPAKPAVVHADAAPIQRKSGDRFYSPLVRNIAKQEHISMNELDAIPGSGAKGRVTKKDIKNYIANRANGNVTTAPSPVVSTPAAPPSPAPAAKSESHAAKPAVSVSGNDEIIQMDRMRKMIADHMVMSKHTSPHVTSFVEADVTEIVNWRNGIKADFQKQYGEKITYTPIFAQAIVQAIRDYPLINVSVDGDKIIKKSDINLGIATALPSGNLIVPVIKNADVLNLVGLTKSINDLAGRARINKLKPDEIQGGTFTLTNVGTFGNVMGTPIINQPQVAIMAVGAIRKKPAVVETDQGDFIGIRHMMFLSLSYDHRVVDGFLGGSFLRKVADYLESFNGKQSI